MNATTAPCAPGAHTLVIDRQRPILITSHDCRSRRPGFWTEAHCVICEMRVMGNNVTTKALP